ncbi:MAG: DUF4133 domain-containing protein [Bacteroidota bacterium]
MSSVYQINKGVNRPIVFKGLKAQYIWWLGVGLTLLLLLFTLMYVMGVPVMICFAFVFGSGTLLFRCVYRFSKRYAEHGLMKKIAKKNIPVSIKCDRIFQ